MISEHKLWAILGVAGAVVMTAYIFFLCQIRMAEIENKGSKVVQAVKLVNAKADELSELISDGRYVRLARITTVDPWNKELGVAYSTTQSTVEELEVRSAGPDGEFNNSDDITVQRWHLIGKN